MMQWATSGAGFSSNCNIAVCYAVACRDGGAAQTHSASEPAPHAAPFAPRCAPAAPCSDYLFKLLLIGDSGVGKSCLLLRFGT
jgi:hypothetical protein